MAKDKNTIRAILICSEGKTEKIFFNIIANNYDIKSRMPVWIEGEKGQLKTLIDYTVAERKKIAKKYNIRQQNIEAWAVCEDEYDIVHTLISALTQVVDGSDVLYIADGQKDTRTVKGKPQLNIKR